MEWMMVLIVVILAETARPVVFSLLTSDLFSAHLSRRSKSMLRYLAEEMMQDDTAVPFVFSIVVYLGIIIIEVLRSSMELMRRASGADRIKAISPLRAPLKGTMGQAWSLLSSLSALSWPRTEQLLLNLSFWIPRRHREGVTGDIFEDCREMRRRRFSERRIRIHVLWQLAIAVIALWPEAVGSAVAAVVKRVWSIRK